MGTNNYIAIFALVLYIAVLISIPINISKKGKREVAQNQKSFLIREVLIFIFTLALIVLCFFIEFGLMSDVILNGCAVIGAFIASKELYQKEENDDE